MKKFLMMLLAVLFCTTAMCTTNVYASVTTSDTDKASEKATSTTENTTDNSDQKIVQSEHAALLNSAIKPFSDEEVYLCAQLVYHEAHNQSFDGKVGVAEVVLNRIRSSRFPDNIVDVIEQNGQFTGVRRIKYIKPSFVELNIAEGVLNGSLRVFNDPTILYFRNPKITSGISAKVEKNWGNLEYATYIGEHAFYSQDTPQRTLSEAEMRVPTSDSKKMSRMTKSFNAKTVASSKETSGDLSGDVTVDAGDLTTDTVSVDTVIAMSQADALEISHGGTQKTEAEEIDENDPVAAVHRQIEIDRQNDLRNMEARENANVQANEAATQQANICVQQAVDLQETILKIGQTVVK